jgi:hypothetical protein
MEIIVLTNRKVNADKSKTYTAIMAPLYGGDNEHIIEITIGRYTNLEDTIKYIEDMNEAHKYADNLIWGDMPNYKYLYPNGYWVLD